MSVCKSFNCKNFVLWVDISDGDVPSPGYCGFHAGMMSPSNQEGLRHIQTGGPFLEPEESDDPAGKDKIILSAEDIEDKKVGDILVCHAGAPGIGCVIYRITRIDAEFVYGFEVQNTTRILDPSEVI